MKGFYCVYCSFIHSFLPNRMVKAMCVRPGNNLRSSNTTSVPEQQPCAGHGSLMGREPSAAKLQ